MIEHEPPDTKVSAPPVTVQTAVEFDAYETGRLDEAVAPSVGGVAVNAVFAGATNVIELAPGNTLKVCATDVDDAALAVIEQDPAPTNFSAPAVTVQTPPVVEANVTVWFPLDVADRTGGVLVKAVSAG